MLSDKAQNQLEALHEKYRKSLPSKLNEAQQLWNDCSELELTKTSASKLAVFAHKLAGSAPSYGEHKLGDTAAQLEKILTENNIERQKKLAAEQMQRLVDELRTAAIFDPHPAAENPKTSTINQESEALDTGTELLIVDDDSDFTRPLELALEKRGIFATSTTSIIAALDSVKQKSPSVVLMDVMLDHGNIHSGFEAAQRVQAACKTPPTTVFISQRRDFDARIHAVNAGGDHYLTKPLDINVLAGILEDAIAPRVRTPYRVLIVDDDGSQCQLYREILETAGCEVSIAPGAGEVMEALFEAQPELLLMDLNMPTWSGLDITRVIRQHEALFDLPILFLAADASEAASEAALTAGADGYINKQRATELLVEAVRNRAKRYRMLQRIVTQDALTGTLNRAGLRERLEFELNRAQRDQQPICLAMIDVDHFKQTNDDYGHLAGDTVLKHISSRLVGRLRRIDVVGRYGGDELCVLLPNTALHDAHNVLETFRRELADQPLKIGDVNVPVTISIGLSGNCVDPKAEPSRFARALTDAADKLLYQAKQAGRNRLLSAQSWENSD